MPAFTPQTVSGAWDEIILATKAHHTEAASRALLPHLDAGGYVVSAQNGLNELAIAEVVGAAVLSAVLALPALAPDVRVNAVAPGPVWTPLNPADKPAEAVAKFGGDTPMKRPAQPEEIAYVVGFLADKRAGYITGQNISPNGGMFISF